MDLYQIFITHNRPWSLREVVSFSILLLAAAAVSCRLLRQRKIAWSQAMAGLLLLIFLGVVFGSTVFTRKPDGVHDYELELFWSWKLVFRGSKGMLKENLLNMILLFPMGVLLPFVFHKKLSWYKGFLAGLAVSAVIELSQLIFCRGLFEWDDMIHNGFGCMVGCMLSGGILRRWKGWSLKGPFEKDIQKTSEVSGAHDWERT